MSSSTSKAWYASSFWIVLYAVVVTVLMAIQFLSFTVTLPYINQVQMPLTIAGYGWSVLIALYTGADRIVDIKESLNMPSGQVSMGDLSKLRGIIVLALILFLVAAAFQTLSDQDFELTAFFTAFAVAIISYCVGNKACKSCKYNSPKLADATQNGIPDKFEEEYFIWMRQQKKNGVSDKYITFDYFLDEHEEIRKKISSYEDSAE